MAAGAGGNIKTTVRAGRIMPLRVKGRRPSRNAREGRASGR